MDRDRRWERTERFYRAVVDGQGAVAERASDAVEASYAAGVTDEFVEPVIVGERSSGRLAEELERSWHGFSSRGSNRRGPPRSRCAERAAPGFYQPLDRSIHLSDVSGQWRRYAAGR